MHIPHALFRLLLLQTVCGVNLWWCVVERVRGGCYWRCVFFTSVSPCCMTCMTKVVVGWRKMTSTMQSTTLRMMDLLSGLMMSLQLVFSSSQILWLIDLLEKNFPIPKLRAITMAKWTLRYCACTIKENNQKQNTHAVVEDTRTSILECFLWTARSPNAVTTKLTM